MHTGHARRSGALVARTLAGAWRQSPPAPRFSADDLAEIAPLLLRSGAAALAWRRSAPPIFEDSPQISELREAYRLHSIEAAVHEHHIKDVFQRMRAAGAEPLLLKGWAIARLYTETGLRPYGDIDLWFAKEQRAVAETALRSRHGYFYCVDLHTSFYSQFERTIGDVFAHSQLVPLDDVSVRTACAEDHLRFLCLHFLFHGGWRPLWLCDIALAVESRGPDFDWDRCLTGKRRHADWIASAIGLAHELLGADVSGTPFERRAQNLPRWLTPAVLEQWGMGTGMSNAETLSFSVPRAILRPGRLVNALREHWRNPLQATVEVGASFGELPRAPLQLGAAVRLVPKLARELGQRGRRQG